MHCQKIHAFLQRRLSFFIIILHIIRPVHSVPYRIYARPAARFFNLRIIGSQLFEHGIPFDFLLHLLFQSLNLLFRFLLLLPRLFHLLFQSL